MYGFLDMYRHVKVKKINDKCTLPTRETKSAVGFDIYACLDEDIELAPFKRVMVPSGFCMEMPENTEAQIRPRSGLAHKYGITTVNSPGTIDPDYRGEIKVLLINLGDEVFTIKHGMRIAQMVIAKTPTVSIDEVENLSDTERGSGGFGSTGL